MAKIGHHHDDDDDDEDEDGDETDLEIWFCLFVWKKVVLWPVFVCELFFLINTAIVLFVVILSWKSVNRFQTTKPLTFDCKKKIFYYNEQGQNWIAEQKKRMLKAAVDAKKKMHSQRIDQFVFTFS